MAQSKNDRRAVVDQIRRQQKRADQRQGAIIVGVCVLIAVAIIGLTAFRPIKDWWDLRKFDDMALADMGTPAAEACAPRTLKKADGSGQHVGTAKVTYTDAPPAFGQHWDTPERFDKWFYDKTDRPPVEQLVHNLEHGYAILWYDETIAADPDKLVELEAVAKKFNELSKQGVGKASNMRAKFKVVPWTSKDGKAFPKVKVGGKDVQPHLAITAWSTKVAEADKAKLKDAEQVGVWQYCTGFSGEALDSLMRDYPYTNSVEPLVEG